MNLGGRGFGELRSHHCTPAWAIRAKLCLKKKKKEKEIEMVYNTELMGWVFVLCNLRALGREPHDGGEGAGDGH